MVLFCVVTTLSSICPFFVCSQCPVWCQNGLVVGVIVGYMKGNPLLRGPNIGESDFHQMVGRFVQGQCGEFLAIGTSCAYKGSAENKYVHIRHGSSPASTQRLMSYIICDHQALLKKPKTPSSFASCVTSCFFVSGERDFCPFCLKPPSRLSPVCFKMACLPDPVLLFSRWCGAG